MWFRVGALAACSVALLCAQEGLKQREAVPAAPGSVQVDAGTHILLNMLNSVSTKGANVGDKVYLATAFPIFADGHLAIPQGSWVTGIITEVKRPGRMRGKGELQMRFDSLTLPNGVSKKFNSDLGAVDAADNVTLNRENSKVAGPGNKKGDVQTVAGTATAGTLIGAAAHGASGAGIGAGAGAAAGLLATMFSRGPDAMLPKGSTVEMVLDRPLVYTAQDVASANDGPTAAPAHGNGFAPAH